MKSNTHAPTRPHVDSLRAALRAICIIACVWCVSGVAAAPADADPIADRRYAFIQEIFNRHDKTLGKYLVRAIENFIIDYPDDASTPEVQLLLGRVHEEHGNEILAFAGYLRTAFIYPDAATYDRAMDNARRIVRAEKSFKEQQSSIEEELNKAPSQGSLADRQMRYLKFLVDFNQKDLMDEIIGEIRSFLKSNPDDPRGEEALHWAAEVSWANGEHAEAAVRYLGLEYLYPDSPKRGFYRYQRATLLADELKDPETAIQLYDEIVQTGAPDLAPQALYQKAKLAQTKQKDYDAALSDLRAIVDDYPQSPMAPDALLAMADIHSKRLKQYDQAIVAYNELVESYGTDDRGPEALIAAAKLYEDKLKDHGRAVAQYASVAELYADAAEAPGALMQAAELADKKLGDVERAIGYYQMLVERYPDFKDAEKARKRITKLRGQ